MKKIRCIIAALLLLFAFGCTATPETDNPAPSVDTNKSLSQYASPGELQAIRRSIDPESPSAVNLDHHRDLMRQKGFVRDDRGWRRVGTR